MILNVLLKSLHLLLKAGFTMASFKDAAFRKELKARDFLLQVRLTKNNRNGYLLLRKGKIKTARKAGSRPPDLLIEWQDSLTALRAMKTLNPKNFIKSMHREIEYGRLSIECDAVSLVWFLNVIKRMLLILHDSGLTSIVSRLAGTVM